MGEATMIVFHGPSLKIEDLPLGAISLPPAQQGDISSASIKYPGETLVLIDGYFRQTLSPWHKEILFAMQVQGCRFIGAGSLGAIRAVECEPWGAEPVGVIAKWYASGTVKDDGEVALAHEGPDSQFAPLTIPLVNLRASGCNNIEEMARIPFEIRTWKAISECIGADASHTLRDNYIDQKRLDAIEAVRIAGATFAKSHRLAALNLGNKLFQGMLDTDLPVNGVRQYQQTTLAERDAAAREHLLLHFADRLGVSPTKRDIAIASKVMWDRLGIPTETESMQWLSDNGITLQEWWSRACNEAKLQNLTLWIEVCESGMQSVPRSLNRQKFYPK